MSVETNKAIIRRWVDEAWNSGDFSSAARLYEGDYTMHANPAPDVHSPQGLAAFIGVYRAAMPDLRMEIQDMVGEGDKVTWRVAVSGTHRADFMGIAPSGNRVAVGVIIISRFVGDTWAEDWVVYDALTMLQQMGVIPAFAPPAGAAAVS